MNPFDQQLHAAKKKQRLLYFGVFALLLIGAAIILSIIMVSRGTRVEIKPDDAATQSSVHLNTGIAVIIGETLYSISKNPVIAVSAEGFQSKMQVLNNNDFGKVMTITLVPLPAKIELSTNITDDKTSWLIDGETLAITDIFEYELAAGDYELTVSHPHHNEEIVTLSLARGEVFKKLIEVDPIDGMMSINTTPVGASVSVDTVDMGLTPLSLPVQGGHHNVTIAHGNYETINDNIEIRRTRPEVNRGYALVLKKARVGVILNPDGGKLTLDGIAVKGTDNVSVEAGIKHRLTYAKQGYFTESKTFNITANEILQLAFELTEEMGTVDIESTPVAEIELNGKLVGTSPLQLSLRAVPQKVTLSRQGHRSITKTVIPSAASSKKINVNLIPEQVARLNEAPGQYTSKAGGSLKLFTPNDTFTMGAERSEPGQRANEFIKTVKLSRAFYAGVHEVTNAEYRQYDRNRQGDPKKPVTSVSWMDVAGFCNWLSQLEGLTPVYHINNDQLQGMDANADGYRLLTEAEWEWLARKSGKSEQTIFVWGNERVIPKNTANVADESAQGRVKLIVSKYNDGYPEMAPVGHFSQEKSGLYDQGGNVSEWTHDSYSIVLPESGKVLQDPLDSAMGSTHVVKGANWRSGSITELRSSFKEGLDGSRDDLGFRIGRYVYGGN
jgi:formylglycine-generating enzyme required for sulfatase activity